MGQLWFKSCRPMRVVSIVITAVANSVILIALPIAPMIVAPMMVIAPIIIIALPIAPTMSVIALIIDNNNAIE